MSDMSNTRRRVQGVVPYKNWEEADEGLRVIGEAQREIEKINHAMQEKIDNAKEEAAAAAAPYQTVIKESEQRLKKFAEGATDDMDGKKSRELNYGFLGFRKSTKLTLPRGARLVAEIIAKLRKRGMTDCIITPPEKINKDALKKYPANDVIEVGAGLDVQDTFWYETKRDVVQEQAP